MLLQSLLKLFVNLSSVSGDTSPKTKAKKWCHKMEKVPTYSNYCGNKKFQHVRLGKSKAKRLIQLYQLGDRGGDGSDKAIEARMY